MSWGSLGGVPFLIDPDSVAYNFIAKTSATVTLGGKVVQVYGVKVSNLYVTGSFGLGSWEYQRDFLNRITQNMLQQVGTNTATSGFVQGQPQRFLYPPRGWDFEVYILDYGQPQASQSVVLDNTIINPQWKLEMFIVNDNGGLQAVNNAALASYLNRLSDGIGWKVNIFNGPVVNPTYQSSPSSSPAKQTNPGYYPAAPSNNQGPQASAGARAANKNP